ncbi:excinuclease ABC subunit UvrC [Patescibacteria group bacterium]|nr:excinuclease ABC subunit UvrC [Patescibacteria group bacterium]
MIKKLAIIPQKPGVYFFRDRKNSILYIGKAINLRSRVRSYFQKSASLEMAKKIMVQKAADVDYIIVDSPTEALLLESSLIKKHRPPYNINLKDDKFFVYLKVTLEEEFPRVLTVRRVEKDKNRYFGPYASATAVKNTLHLLKRIFPYKICKNPPEKLCLGYHIGKCLGHITDTHTKRDYQQIIQGILHFLEGKNTKLLSDLKKEMKDAAKKNKFEKAARLRDQIFSIESVMERQKVVSTKKENQDFISIVRSADLAAINLFMVREGKLIHHENFLLEHTKLQPDGQVLESFLNQYYSQVSQFPKEVFIPFDINNAKLLEHFTTAKIIIPRKGKKFKLLELGKKNAEQYLNQRELEEESRDQRGQIAISELGKKLGIKKVLRRIEAYDISNIQGTNAVGSMVVFSDGLSDKSQYRKFSIKTVRGANDVAMMREVLSRRFQKIKSDKKNHWALPDLIILDGGKGQLGAGVSVLEKNNIRIPIIALAKQEEEIFIPSRKNSMKISHISESLKLIQRIRDEAHRFAIGFYRSQHRKSIHKSVLDEVPGIGPKLKKKLINEFKSVHGILEASDDQLEKILGNKLAKNIKQYL